MSSPLAFLTLLFLPLGQTFRESITAWNSWRQDSRTDSKGQWTTKVNTEVGGWYIKGLVQFNGFWKFPLPRMSVMVTGSIKVL